MATLKTFEPDLFLLDTHVWLWFVQGGDTLKPNVREMLREAAAAERLRLAIISIWEIALLASRNRIALDKPVMAWTREGILKSRVVLDPLSPEIAVASCHLPADFRSDPADQLIVATARETRATLVTRDRRILDYAALGHIATLPA